MLQNGRWLRSRSLTATFKCLQAKGTLYVNIDIRFGHGPQNWVRLSYMQPLERSGNQTSAGNVQLNPRLRMLHNAVRMEHVIHPIVLDAKNVYVYHNFIIVFHILIFYHCDPCPSRVVRVVEAHAVCPTYDRVDFSKQTLVLLLCRG